MPSNLAALLIFPCADSSAARISAFSISSKVASCLWITCVAHAEVLNLGKKLDKVAYVRFASVYRSFEDIDEFKTLVDEVRR